MLKNKLLIISLIVIAAGGALIYAFMARQERTKLSPKTEAVITPKSPSQEAPATTSAGLASARTSPKRLITHADKVNELIEQLGSKDWPKSQEAADRLAQMGAKAAPELIKKLKEKPSVFLKGQITFLLGRIGDKQAVSVLEDATRDENAYIRRNAVEALAKIGDPSAASALEPLLFDADAGVRQSAVAALAELKPNQVVADLLNMMIDEKDEGVKTASVKVLGETKDSQATETLLEELRARNDQTYKNKVVASLGEIADPEALAPLTEYLNNLKQLKPPEELMIKFQWEDAIKIAEDAIEKIQKEIKTQGTVRP